MKNGWMLGHAFYHFGGPQGRNISIHFCELIAISSSDHPGKGLAVQGSGFPSGDSSVEETEVEECKGVVL